MKKQKVLALLLAATMTTTTVAANGTPVFASESAGTEEQKADAGSESQSDASAQKESQVQETPATENGGGRCKQ